MVHVNALFTPLVTQTIVTIACISVLPGACQSSHPLRPAAFVHAPSHREHASSGAFDAWFRKRRIAERQCARLPVFREHGCVLEARQSRSAQIPGQLSRGAPHDSENVSNHATGWSSPRASRTTKSAVQFRKSGGVLYVRNFLGADEFAEVQREAAALKKKARPERSSFAHGRTGAYVPRGRAIEAQLFTASTARRLQDLTGINNLVPSDYPMEVRVYSAARASGMEWHSDDLLCSPPQLEFVYTVSNDGDSHTAWRDPAGEVHQVWAEPNSILLIQAGAAPHRVSKMRRGERVILKGVFCDASAQPLAAFNETQGQF